MVLCRQQRDDGFAVDQAEQGDLRAVEERFEQDWVSCRVNLVHVLLGSSAIIGDHNTLAASKSIILDHEVRAEAVECCLDLGIGRARRELLRTRRLHASCIHDVLGKSLGTLDLSCGLVGAKHGDAVGTQLVGNAGHKRHLGADDDELGVNLLRQLKHLSWVIYLGVRRVHGGQVREIRRARGNVKFGGQWICLETFEQGVFAAARANYENAHAVYLNWR